jgi:arylsulfatase A-like enzyme
MMRILFGLFFVALAAAKTNVVLIVSDDQGYGDISCYQHPPDVSTPNLDRLAGGGARMTNGYASCPVCSPTRAGVLTGRYQQRFGFYTAADSRAGLPTSEITVADLLSKAGYATGVFGKWHLGYDPPYRPLQRGFQRFYGFLGHGGHDYFDLSLTDEIRSIYRGAEPIADTGYLTRNLAREAVAFIESNRERPFFLYLPFNAVHFPLQAPEEEIARYKTGNEERNTYLAMLRVMDEGVGAVLDTLDRLGLEKDTLVLFFSDNGGARNNASNNGPLRGHKHSVYEGGVRVPFLVRWPTRIPAGVTSDEPVISIDAFATILAAAGIEPPADRVIDSRDITPALTGNLDGPLHERLFWNWMDKDADDGWAIRKGRWKLLADKNGMELYDLTEDLGETRNLVRESPERVRELLADYQSWRSEIAPRIQRQRER